MKLLLNRSRSTQAKKGLLSSGEQMMFRCELRVDMTPQERETAKLCGLYSTPLLGAEVEMRGDEGTALTIAKALKSKATGGVGSMTLHDLVEVKPMVIETDSPSATEEQIDMMREVVKAVAGEIEFAMAYTAEGLAEEAEELIAEEA